MKNFGFGCMRLPMKDGVVEIAQFSNMVDRFLAEGFTYFDTAHGYLGGKSELALRDCLTSRYPRQAYQLTNKLSTNFFNIEADIRPLFENQLQACGVEYFDYYLMHAQTADNYQKFVDCGAYRIAEELKSEGKVKHIGLSFHDKATVLQRILSEQPEIEVVQLQLNYVDYDNSSIEGGKCLAVCREFKKPVIVMEPVKGGSLVNLPDEAKEILDELAGGSYASYAVRYAASLEGILLVLSGMSNLAQLEDNISYMKEFKPLTPAEFVAIDQVSTIFKKQDLIPCTACQYCIDGCPMKIAIPDLFACMNAKQQFKDWNSSFYYNVHIQNAGKASDCIQCGKCETACPQHLEIRKLLVDVAANFENK